MSNEKKMYTFAHIHQPRLYASKDLARGVSAALAELDAIFISAMSKIKAIKDSGEFTQKGKQTALGELSVEVERLIKDWQKVIEGYETQIGQLEREMQPKRNRQDDGVAEMRQREVRDYLRTLDPIDLEARFVAATEQGDELFLAAVEKSPIPFTFATKNLIEKARFQRLSVAYPVQAQKVADLQVASQSASFALATVGAEASAGRHRDTPRSHFPKPGRVIHAAGPSNVPVFGVPGRKSAKNAYIPYRQYRTLRKTLVQSRIDR